MKEHVETASYFRSDGIIITGSSTGKEALIDDVKIASQSTSLPVIIGSGITTDNIENYWDFADAFVVGSWFKFEGKWENSISKERVSLFMKKVKELRRS